VSRILRLALLAPDLVDAILGKDRSGRDAGEAGAAAAGELGGAALDRQISSADLGSLRQ
jgi:hypothetical protein